MRLNTQLKMQKWVAALGLVLCATAVHAEGISPDSVSLEYGTGNVTRIERVGLQWDWNKAWFESNGNHISGYWDATLAQWQGRAWDGHDGHDRDLADIGITPVFRWESDDKLGWYGEAGIGAHLLSHLYDNNRRDFSTAYQFGDHLGFGYQAKAWSVGLKLQHFSNGGIKHPNPGANFAVIGVDFKL